MNTTLRHILPVTALLFAAASPLPAQTVEIKPRWQVGKKFTQTMHMDQVDSSIGR